METTKTESEPEHKTEHKTEPEIKIVYIYSSYTPNSKASTYKYREVPENKQRVKEINRRCYLKRMENPEYRARMNAESKERYRKKKEKENIFKLAKLIEDIV